MVGAREFGKSEDYVRALLGVECVVDVDATRREEELSIYR